MEAKGSVAAAEAWEGMNQVRRINVIYFLCRMGRIEHPHLIRVHHFSRNGVHLRDVKRWLSDLRGKDMPDSFSWSYKRRYKRSYVWQDLVDDDLITPISDNEYVLKGSEIYSVPFGFTDARPCGEKKASTENPQKKMEVSPKTSEEIEIVTDEETSEPFESERSTTTDESMKSNARKPEKEENNSEKNTEKTKPPLTHSTCFSKSKSYSSGTSYVFRNLLTCDVVDTNESAIMTINRVNRTTKNASNEAGFCKAETMGGSQRIFGNAWDQQPRQQNSRKSFTGVKTPKSMNELANQKKNSAACKPIVEPNCSQCGKAFKPEKLHSHMKSCKGMKSLNKNGGGGAAAATITLEKTSSRRSTDTSKEASTYFLTC
ncbi:protein SOSEKI 1-like isoform X2 [Macadamia integrifolia]|uniref:protein SOSEKI 1-like isoform X2 n=1 Tax=Macadamia integrifolia TaxID=60698 RepID=UPI001C4E4AFB|nr:protein SOSEKI 1-like isoform X2 [Macadamia integrifolia]